jgi:hypothetical protein
MQSETDGVTLSAVDVVDVSRLGALNWSMKLVAAAPE